MPESPRQFGDVVPDETYVLRPGGYAVICRPDRHIAVVTVLGKSYLPGGRQEGTETPAEAAIREAREECGLGIRIVRQIGMADELAYSGDEATYFRKRCTFFLAEMATDAFRSSEPDHVLSWLYPQEAECSLYHGSQRWAVAEAFRQADG